MASENSGGSQYALTALGVGMLALGIIMVVWSVVPGYGKGNMTHGGNSSTPAVEESKSKVSQVSYILCAGGVVLLLLSICLSIREKKRRRTQEEVVNVQCESTMLAERGEDNSSRLAVPSYDEVMQGDSTQQVDEPGISQGEPSQVSLPSYESLAEVGAASSPSMAASTGTSAQPKNERQASRPGRRFSSKKIRRILSDRSHIKNFRLHLSNANSTVVNIEPLTPPPQYEDGEQKSFEYIKPS
ncbi:transmembrane protein 51-like [Heptranchias perlo]|uniref:transmembrane protein 51-like n=1 Tax=Heptranchias perlo TaxID=212740 RepID=UPI00355A7D19